jgi:transketolase
VRNQFAQSFYDLALHDERLCMVVADISPAGAMEKFRETYPERFINTGVAEQIMIGLCAGMALRGLRPFAYTIATFALFRCFEFVRDDLAYQNLPVTVVGMGASASGYSTLGATHQAMEDVAIASAVPNLSVLAPCDPLETRAATEYCVGQEIGPIYMRIGKTGEADLTSAALEPFEFGRLRYLRRGRDICIMGYGPVLKSGVELAALFEARGDSVSIISVHTPKPLDSNGVREALHAHRQVIVLEEMVPQGGLGARVKEIAWDSGATCRIDCFALRHEFLHCYGSPAQFLAAHGLDSASLAARLGLGAA